MPRIDLQTTSDPLDGMSETLDRAAAAVPAQMTFGLSPATLARVFSDWALHLAVAPSKLLQLSAKSNAQVPPFGRLQCGARRKGTPSVRSSRCRKTVAPTLEEKANIIRNAIDIAHVLGEEEPKVAILSAVDTINPAFGSTLDSAALCKMVDRGQITGGILDGPQSRGREHAREATDLLGDADAAGIVLGARLDEERMIAFHTFQVIGKDPS